MSETGNGLVKFFGGLLLAIGILIATVSGLCTLFVMVGSGGGNGMANAALLFGGLPFAVGVGLILVGMGMVKAGPPSDPGSPV